MPGMKEVSMESLLEVLKEDGVSACFSREGEIVRLGGRRIRPLVELHLRGGAPEGSLFADKVIGRAAASFLILWKVSEAYGALMSEPARRLLESHGIKASWGKVAPNILREDGQDLCPMEKIAIEANEDPEETVRRVMNKVIGQPNNNQ